MLRKALRQLGYYKDAQTAKEYYENLTAEIQRCVDSGELKTANGKNKLRVSVTPPIKGEYVLPVLAETFKGFGMVITFGQCDPLAEHAVGKDYEIAQVRDFINREGAVVCVENTDIPYLPPIRRLSHKFMRVMISIYKVCMPIMLLITFTWQIKKLIRDIKEKKFDRSKYVEHNTFRPYRHGVFKVCHDRIYGSIQLCHRHICNVSFNCSPPCYRLRIFGFCQDI